MKLQINSLAAIERLIGGESEVELDIRNNIVEAFAKKHLKPVLNSPVFQRVVVDIQSQYDQAMISQVGNITNFGRWDQKVVLKPELLETLRTTARAAANAAIQEQIDNGVKAAVAIFTPAYIQNQIEKRVTEVVAKQISEGVDARLKQITAAISG